MCKCISYIPYTKVPRESYQTVLPVEVEYPFTGETVEIDSCIVDTMKHLWAKGIETASCCCGHNTNHGPSCILRNPFAGEDEYDIARRVIEASGDERCWKFLSAPARWPYLKESIDGVK